MKKIALCILVLLCMVAISNAFADTQSILTEGPWTSSSGIEVLFEKDGKGRFNQYDMTYDVSGNSVTISYSVMLQWGDSEHEYPVTLTFHLIEDNGYRCLSTNPDATWKTATYYPKSQYNEICDAAASGAEVYDASLGEEIDLGVLKFTLSDIKTVRKIGKTGYTIQADEKGIPLVFSGTIENTGKKEIDLKNLSSFLIIGNESFSADARTEINDSMEMSIPALGKGTLYIACNLNDTQRNSLSGASLIISVNEGIDAPFAFPCSGDINLRWTIDDQKAQDGDVAQVKAEYFEECPALPTPENYFACTMTGQFTHSTNNKVTSISYSYAASGMSASEFVTQYCEHLKNAGYSINKSGSKWTVSYNNKKLAEFEAKDTTMQISIIPGNQNFTSRP